MRYLLCAWLLAWCAGLAVAQRPRWERLLDFAGTDTDQFGYMRPLPGGDHLVYGVGSASRGYPAIVARYRPDGTLVYQGKGRTFWTLEQDILPLPSGNLLRVASVDGGRLFFQRQRPPGDTLPGLRYPASLFNGFPARMQAGGDSVRVLLTAVASSPEFPHFALVTADTAGQLGVLHHYPNPSAGVAYACDLVPTPRGGWLLAGEFYAISGTALHPYLTEVDARGRLLRQRVLTLFSPTDDERVARTWHNLLKLRDGSGYVLSGWQQVGGTSSANPTWGWLCKLDTALNVVWTYRHPPQARSSLLPTQVRELPDGSLGWVACDSKVNGQTYTPYLYIMRVSAQGQLLGQRTFTSEACSGFRLYSWQPTPDGYGAIVTGGYATCTATGTALVAYTARLDDALVLTTAPPGGAAGPAQLWPNPATEAVTWQGAVPAGAGPAELLVLDALGREVRRVAVAGRGAQVQQTVGLGGLAPGTYVVRLLVGGLPQGVPGRLLVEP